MFIQENIDMGSAIGTCSLVFCSALFVSVLAVAFIHKNDISLIGKRRTDTRLCGDSMVYHHPGIDFEDTWQYDDDEYVGRESYEKYKIKEMAVFESTPSGDVYIEYNKEHCVFHYWSDRVINYLFLSTLARKYNIVFDMVTCSGSDSATGSSSSECDGVDNECDTDSDDFLFVKPKEDKETKAGTGAGTGTSVPLYRFIRKGSIDDYIFKHTACDDDEPLAMSYSDFIKNRT